MRWYSLYKIFTVYIFKLIDNDPETQVAGRPSLSAMELKRLLVNIQSYANGVGFRCKPHGEMWTARHARVSSVNDSAVVLYDEKEMKYYMLAINKITQFDLDNRFQNFQPHCLYDVVPSAELD